MGSSNCSVAHENDPNFEVFDLDQEPQNIGPSTLASQVEVFDLEPEVDVGLGPVSLESGFGWEHDNIEQGIWFNVDFGIGVDDVNEEEEPRDLEDNTDSSNNSIYYSDHSYHESDDDGLYEAFVDKEVEFFGVPLSNEKMTVVDNESLLSDEDSKHDSENSLYSSSDEVNETDMEDPRFKLGMFFSTTKDFKTTIKEHAIKHQRNVKLVKNDQRRVRARCEVPCEWEVYIVKVMAESTYQVRTYTSTHTCTKTCSNRNVTSTIIARRYMEDLRTNPWIPITAFKARVRKEMKCDVSKSQLYRAKRKATKLIYGSDLEQYGRLWDYCEELRRFNPSSTVVMDAPLDEESGQPMFNRLYIFLAAPKTGFLNGCRKIVGLDGCHLKREYTGQLLTAVGVDPINAMYPMAYSVVETESKDTWTWFLHY